MNFNLIQNLILKVEVILGWRKSKFGPGGNGGDIFIAARKIIDNGSGPMIEAKGGDGSVGGKGGSVTVISDEIQSNSKKMIDASGGKSIK